MVGGVDWLCWPRMKCLTGGSCLKTMFDKTNPPPALVTTPEKIIHGNHRGQYSGIICWIKEPTDCAGGGSFKFYDFISSHLIPDRRTSLIPSPVYPGSVKQNLGENSWFSKLLYSDWAPSFSGLSWIFLMVSIFPSITCYQRGSLDCHHPPSLPRHPS